MIPIVAGLFCTRDKGNDMSKSKDIPTTFCTIEGCGKPRRARMLCATHYNKQHRKPNPTAEFGCPMCGKTFTTERARAKRYAKLYCSITCRDRGRSALSAQVEVWKPRPVLHWAIERMPLPPRPPRPRTITAGYCVVCGTAFVRMHNIGITCSGECSNVRTRDAVRDAKHRRRARQRDAFVAPVYRHDIYRRDEWTCQLCGLPLDMTAQVPMPLAPTIDHVLALANGGTHEPSNAQAAHFICNVRKSASADVLMSA